MTLSLDRLQVRYGAREAVAPTTVHAACGDLVALIGPNGAGKSSLLKAIAGLVRADGCVTWQGRPVLQLAPLARARTIAYLPQTPAAHWPIKAADLVALGRLPHAGFGRRCREVDTDVVARALDRCGAAELAARRVDRLSGGELARVLLARALAVEAPVLLVDEPTQSLDPFHQLEIMNVLRDYADTGKVVVIVLHDLSLAARFCRRVVLLHEGVVAGDGVPEDVLAPEAVERYYRVHPYIARHDDSAVIVPWRRVSGEPSRPRAER